MRFVEKGASSILCLIRFNPANADMEVVLRAHIG
jgi:hypothetical protein